MLYVKLTWKISENYYRKWPYRIGSFFIHIKFLYIFIKGLILKQNITKNQNIQSTNQTNEVKQTKTNTTFNSNANTHATNTNTLTNTETKSSEAKTLQSTQSSSTPKSQTPSTTNKNTTVSTNTKDDSKIVYVTPTGKRYHYISTCGGKNSTASTLNNAKARGLTPCKKCAQ